MTKLLTEFAVDDPIELTSGSRFGIPERRRLDEQIRAIQGFLVAGVLKDVQASWYRLSASSVAIEKGDSVCLSGEGGTVTKATTSALSSAKAILGVAVLAASPGARVFVATAGILGPEITGLEPGSGFGRINTSTSRVETVTELDPVSDHGAGIVDPGGYLQIFPGLAGSYGGNSRSSSVFTWSPTAAPQTRYVSYEAQHIAEDSSPATALVVPLGDDRTTDITVHVLGRNPGKHFALDLRAGYEATGGVFTTVRTPSTSSPGDANPVGWNAVIDRDGANARVLITSESDAVFSVIANCQIVLALTPGEVVIDPSLYPRSGDWLDYSSVFPLFPWAGTSTTSPYAKDLNSGNFDPEVGAYFGTHPSATFDGVGSNYLLSPLTVDSFLNPEGYTIEIICAAAALAADSAEPTAEPLLLGDNDANLYLAISASGVRFGHKDVGGDGWTDYAAVPAVGTKMCIQAVYNGTTAKVRVNGGAWESVARAAGVNFDTNVLRIGRNYDGTAHFNGDIARIRTVMAAEDDATLDGTYAFARANFAVA